MAIRKARDAGRHISYFGPEATTLACWNKPSLNMVRAAKGISQISAYLRRSRTVESGTGDFTPWQPLPEPTDVLFYEGLQAASSRHSITLRSMWTYWSACAYR